MVTTPFSSKTVLMLEDNEFTVKKEGSFLTFRKVSVAKSMLLIPAFFLTLIAVVHIQQHPVKTLAAILIISLFTKALWVGITKKIHFQVDFSDSTFKFYDRDKTLHWYYLQDIAELSWSSRLVSERTNSFKNTSQEHEVSINFRLNNGRMLNVFNFVSDHAEPTPEIIEIYSFLENTVKKIKVI